MANVQRAAKNVIYAVSTTNAMDAAGKASLPAAWEIALIIANIIVFGGGLLLIVWTTLRLVKTLKSRPKKDELEGDDIVKKKIVVILTIAALVVGLGAGALVMRFAGGSSGGSGAEIANVYVYGEAAGNSMGDNDFVEYELTLYTDGTYKLTTSNASCGYGMLLANTVTTAYGTYTKGASTDGYTACELSEAARIVYNGYSDVGGYNMSYDTDTISSYPIEMPGAVMTEKADFWAMFGPARTVSLDDASQSRMLLETGAADPNPIGGSGGSEDTQPSEEPEPSQEPAAGAVTVVSDDGATTMTFNPDGTYVFSFESYGVEDKGSYTYEGGKLTLVNTNGAEATAEGDPLKLHYVTAVSDQLTGDFTVSAADLPSSGSEVPTEPAAELVTVASDDGATTMTFNADGTYVFFFESYGVEDKGTYTYEGGRLTLVNANGVEATAEGDPLKLYYVTAVSDQLTGDFTISAANLAV